MQQLQRCFGGHTTCLGVGVRLEECGLRDLSTRRIALLRHKLLQLLLGLEHLQIEMATSAT